MTVTRKKQTNKQQEIMNSCEDPKEYYHKVLIAKQNGEDWAKDIPLDLVPDRGENHKCLYCGNPNMADSLSGSECKRCGIKRLQEIYGMAKDLAIIEYEYRLKKKVESEDKWAEFVEQKYLNSPLPDDPKSQDVL